MRKLKLLVILVFVLSIAFPAFGATVNEWQLAELLAQPQARSRISGNSVLFTVYYRDNTRSDPNYAEYGISGSTTAFIFNLYEAGAIPSTARFGGSDGAIDTADVNYDTIGELVDAINADTSGYWKAILGPDAYYDMPCEYMMNKLVDLVVGTEQTAFDSHTIVSANTAAANAKEVRLDVGEAKGITCGVRAETDARVRLKEIHESTVSSKQPHWLEVYSGTDIIYRRGFTDAQSCQRDDAYAEAVSGGDTSTPNTINLAEGHRGVGSLKGENLCVFTRWNTLGTIRGDYNGSVTGNLSITYDVVKP